MATRLDLADAQFIGYHHGRREGRIIGMIMSMGLTEKEWVKWKSTYPTYPLSDDDIVEINEYFERRPNKNL